MSNHIHSLSTKQTDAHRRSLHRIKIISGQIKGLQKMIENHSYCVDVITQSQAIQQSLKSLDSVILASHLKTCVAKQLTDPKTQKKAITEVVRVFEKT
ncbi:MAG: metal-sensitive transcriptional regulator [bacterium]